MPDFGVAWAMFVVSGRRRDRSIERMTPDHPEVGDQVSHHDEDDEKQQACNLANAVCGYF